MKVLSLLATFTGLLPVAILAQTVIQNTTYTSGQNVTVTGVATISANTNVTVASGATVTYDATTTVTLGPGFTASSGSSFRAVVTPILYALTVLNGSGSGSFASGSAQSVSATTPLAYAFSSWVIDSGPGSLANASAAATTFTLGSGASTIRATFVAVLTDTDADGVPDSVEQQLGTNANAAGTVDPAQTQLKVQRPNQ